MHGLLHQLLTEWGAFLEPCLYRDALVHILGGIERVEREIPVTSGGVVIGTQKMHLLADDIAFTVTASTRRPDAVREHQRRFLRHTSLQAIHWVNLNHHHIELRTIQHQ